MREPGVVEVHDLHVWEVASGFPALSAHVLVEAEQDCHAARRAMESVLHERFGLDHTTLQVDQASAVSCIEYRSRHQAGNVLDQGSSSMTKSLYTARAHVTGGRAKGHGRTSDSELEVDLRVPAEMGGEGGGTNPEELFAVGYAACFEGALSVVGRRMKQETDDAEIESSVS